MGKHTRPMILWGGGTSGTGAVVGGLIGGPVGAAVGFVAGAAVDAALIAYGAKKLKEAAEKPKNGGKRS